MHFLLKRRQVNVQVGRTRAEREVKVNIISAGSQMISNFLEVASSVNDIRTFFNCIDI